jgi:hypothetical protein
MNWSDVYGVLFARQLDEVEIATWGELLDEDFPGRGVDMRGRWSADELKAALKAVSEERRKGGHRGQAPEYPQIKTAIIRARYDANREAETPPSVEECGLCGGTGLLLCYHALPADASARDKMTAYRCGVPCFCGRGRRHMAATTDFSKSGRLPELRELARDQRRIEIAELTRLEQLLA